MDKYDLHLSVAPIAALAGILLTTLTDLSTQTTTTIVSAGLALYIGYLMFVAPPVSETT